MNTIRQFFNDYIVSEAAALSPSERWRSTVAAFVGILVLEAVLAVLPAAPESRQLLAPAGATAVILFSLPHSPLAQPWSVIGGMLISALVGLACGLWISVPWLMVASAVAISIWLMAALRCLHPPGGAMAVVMALLAHQSSGTVLPSLSSVALNITGLLMGALLANNLLKGRTYPQCEAIVRNTLPTRSFPSGGIQHEDLSDALKQIDSYLDISESDLVALFTLATNSAFRRTCTLSILDLMVRKVTTIAPDASLADARALMCQYALTVLPVIDRDHRLIGLLTPEQLLEERPNARSETKQLVRKIMAAPSAHLTETDSISTALQLLGTQHTPQNVMVVDARGRLIGALSPSAIITALYHQHALAQWRPENS